MSIRRHTNGQSPAEGLLLNISQTNELGLQMMINSCLVSKSLNVTKHSTDIHTKKKKVKLQKQVRLFSQYSNKHGSTTDL